MKKLVISLVVVLSLALMVGSAFAAGGYAHQSGSAVAIQGQTHGFQANAVGTVGGAGVGTTKLGPFTATTAAAANVAGAGGVQVQSGHNNIQGQGAFVSSNANAGTY